METVSKRAGSAALDWVFLAVLTSALAFFVALFCSAVHTWIDPGLMPNLNAERWQPISLAAFGLAFLLLVFRQLPPLRQNPLPLVLAFFATGFLAGLLLFNRAPDLVLLASL